MVRKAELNDESPDINCGQNKCVTKLSHFIGFEILLFVESWFILSQPFIFKSSNVLENLLISNIIQYNNSYELGT